ncbi:MAG: acyl-CoA dehydrogenase family protein, partial [Parahaliea sp.]
MDFSFSEEQQLLKSSLHRFLSDRYSFHHRRATSNSEVGWDRAIWIAFARELGILAMPLPEAAGGLACDALNTLVVMEELGRNLVIEPYLESVVLCGELLKQLPGEESLDLL